MESPEASSDDERDYVNPAQFVPLKKNYKKRRHAVSTEVINMDYPTDEGKP